MFGVGYETIEKILDVKPLSFSLLLLLLMAKLILTPISSGGGFFGGVFAPSLFLGATLGGAYGLIVQQLFPGLAIAPPAFAMVGMAAVLAGAVHAPLTAIILLFEMTNEYRIILPLMFAVTVSLFISRYLQRDSVYTFGLMRKGIRLERGRVVDVLESITVDEIMEKRVVTLREADSLTMASNLLLRTRHRSLPVVLRNNPKCLVGVLSSTDIVRAYDLALTRREQIRHLAQTNTFEKWSGLGNQSSQPSEEVEKYLSRMVIQS